MSGLTQKLLLKGDEIVIYKGQLIITPGSGKPVPKEWLKKNSRKIMSEISQQIGYSIFTYSYYKTGRYNQGRSPGVMVRFADTLSGEDAFAIFNAELNRQRTTLKGRAGESRPSGHFSIGNRSALYKLWLKTDLDIPRRFSEWHKSMSKLDQIYFEADKSTSGKLSNKSITPLSVNCRTIKQLFSDNIETSQGQVSDNLMTRNSGNVWRQKIVTSNGDKKNAARYTDKSMESESNCVSEKVRALESAGEISTSASNSVLSNQVMACEVVPLPTNKKVPQEQSVDEWLDDYNSGSS